MTQYSPATIAAGALTFLCLLCCCLYRCCCSGLRKAPSVEYSRIPQSDASDSIHGPPRSGSLKSKGSFTSINDESRERGSSDSLERGKPLIRYMKETAAASETRSPNTSIRNSASNSATSSSSAGGNNPSSSNISVGNARLRRQSSNSSEQKNTPSKSSAPMSSVEDDIFAVCRSYFSPMILLHDYIFIVDRYIRQAALQGLHRLVRNLSGKSNFLTNKS